jgi:hypothetical protein
MRDIVVVNELGGHVVGATSKHAAGCFLGCELLGVDWSVCRVGRVATDHLLVLAHGNALSLDLLDILEAGKNLVLNDEGGLDLVSAALFDVEGVVLECGLGARLGEIDRYVGSAIDLLYGSLVSVG